MLPYLSTLPSRLGPFPQVLPLPLLLVPLDLLHLLPDLPVQALGLEGHGHSHLLAQGPYKLCVAPIIDRRSILHVVKKKCIFSRYSCLPRVTTNIDEG